MSLVYLDNGAAVQAAFDNLVSAFSSQQNLPGVIYTVAEQYYIHALQLEGQGLTSQSRDCQLKAVNIWATVINQYPSSSFAPQACYWTADYYRNIRDYSKSIEYCKRIVDNYPDYSMAWNALFLIGLNYQDSEIAGQISADQADIQTRAAYQQLIEKYPNSKAVPAACLWLQKNNQK